MIKISIYLEDKVKRVVKETMHNLQYVLYVCKYYHLTLKTSL